MIGFFSLVVKIFFRLFKVKIVDLFFKVGLELKKFDYMIRKFLFIFWFVVVGNFLIFYDILIFLLIKCF